MNNYIKSIMQVCSLEEELNIYDTWICGLPIWKCVYRKYRDRFIEDTCGVPPMNNHAYINIKNYILSTVKSFVQYINFIFSRKNIDNVIYGFPRLEHIENVYVDKFCDEFIKQSEIAKSYLYIERGRSGFHPGPRQLSNIMWLEFIDNVALIGSKLIAPFLYRKYRKQFSDVFFKANKLCRFGKSDEKYVVKQVGRELIRFKLTKLLFKRLRIKRIFATTLQNKPYLIATAKALEVPCYEIQHGITETLTPMYSGKYLVNFSPTLFLAFGKTSMIPVFNVPLEKMRNIGFAYKTFLNSKVSQSSSGQYLLVSDPEVTQEIIDVACQLKKEFPEIKFSIRFHPMEKASPLQLRQLLEAEVEVADNHENSSLAVLKYSGVIGEKSSVLYEALSMGRKAAKIHFHKLNIGINEEEENLKGFFILNSSQDFGSFHKKELNKSTLPEFYSDFNPIELNKLLK